MSNYYDSLSYVWSNAFVKHIIDNITEPIFSEKIEAKYENIKLAFLRQMVSSRHAIVGEGVGFSVALADDFKFDFASVFEHHLLKWVAYLNFVDEITQCPEVDYASKPDFNSIKLYHFLQELSIDCVISKLSDNLALFTELIYFQEFFNGSSFQKLPYMIILLVRKICVFALVWVEKVVFDKVSPLSKKLAEIVVNAKIYSMVLSLVVTTTRKMFGFFDLLANKKVETRYEKLIVLSSAYKSLHDFMYTNLIVSMYEYENATSDKLGGMRAMTLKDVTQNFTLNEMRDSMYDENASVFKDTTIYERLDDKTKQLLTEKELYSDASNWFKDLTKQQKSDVLPYLMINKGGRSTKAMLRREDAWFVNGGEETTRMDEWSIWRRYVTLLTVQYLETIEQNGVEVEVIILYLYFIFYIL